MHQGASTGSQAGAQPHRPRRPSASAPAAPLVRAAPYADILAFVASVGVLLIFSGSWGAILTDYGAKSADFLRNGYYPAYGLAVVLVCTRPGQALKAVLRSPLMVVLLLLAALSFFWSITPDVTLRRVMALVFTTLGGVALAARWRWRTLAEIIAVAMAVMAIISLLLGALLPDMGRMQELFPGAWRGLWLEKNGLGNNMVMATAATLGAAIMVPARRRLWLGLSLIPIALVALSTSKTALIVLILVLGSMAFVGVVKSGPKRAVAATWLGAVGLIGAVLIITTQSELLFEVLGKDATLTGRTEIWSGIMRQMADHPWLGFGYGAVWDDPSFTGPKAWIAHEARFSAANAHSGWLEIYLGLGLGGVILFVAWVALVWLQALWTSYTSEAAWLLMPMMTSYTITMMSESVGMNWHDLRWVLFVTLALKAMIGDPPQPQPRAVRPARSTAAARLS